MSGSVSIAAMQLGLFFTLALLCGLLYFVLKRESALVWLGIALLMGVIETLLFKAWPSDRVEQISAVVYGPFGYLCVSNALRLLTGDRRPEPRGAWAVCIGLSLAAIAMILAGVSFYWSILMFQLAMTVSLAISARRLFDPPRPNPLDGVLLGLLALLAILFLARVPLWLAFGPQGADYATVRHSAIDAMVLTIGGSLSMIVALLMMVRAVAALVDHLRHRSERDGLSGLLNRAAFLAAARQVQRRPGAIAYCDLDHFKRVNDRYGHAAGDEVICTIARLLDRTGYVAGRLGGEEFALLMPSTNAARAFDTADELRRAFTSSAIDGVVGNDPLTASFGIAMFQRGDRPIDFLDRADRALYIAKNNGRDQVALLNPVDLDVTSPVGDAGPRLAAGAR